MALVIVNVGGVKYTTSALTLNRWPQSKLARMFQEDPTPASRDSKGRHFIDRDGNAFNCILRYLRDDNTCLPESSEQRAILKQEAEFYQLDNLCARLRHAHGKSTALEKRAPAATSLKGTIVRAPSSAAKNIDLTTSVSSAEASHLKMEWIRQSAPMPVLRKAMEGLLKAFWARAQQPQKQGIPASLFLPTLCPAMASDINSVKLPITAERFTPPPALVFMEVTGMSSRSSQINWHFISANLQETVHQWFLLFSFELHELGYKVSQNTGSGAGPIYSCSISLVT